MATLPRLLTDENGNVQLRGVTPRAFEVRGGIRIVEGRAFQPGLTEVIVGERLPERFRNVSVGSLRIP